MYKFVFCENFGGGDGLLFVDCVVASMKSFGVDLPHSQFRVHPLTFDFAICTNISFYCGPNAFKKILCDDFDDEPELFIFDDHRGICLRVC